MSRQLIQQYYSKVDKVIQYGGIKNETAIRGAFHYLLNQYAEKRNLLVVEECPVQGTKGRNVIPDGVLKNAFRLDLGIWESKDEADTLDDEIDKKLKKGYPFYNALFEDSRTAVLFQYGEKVATANIREPDELDKLLDSFLDYRNEYIEGFEKALEQFRNDIPTILETLRNKIDGASKENKNFVAAQNSFLELCKAEINPDITLADVREMMIQHILTSDIFNIVFDDPEFHRHNTIAAELEKLTNILFSYSERKNLLMSIEHYYDAINSAAASISDHHEKQKFLKSLYENFYKVYNPKAADRLGVVYTPNEIVNFMIESTDYLLNKHFGKTLADKNVEILDPATGTGTFICDIIEHIPKQQLLYKYKNELHANEVAILPYYISNLNIEYTFKQKMGMYEEFTNLCFVDTLDNTAALAYAGKQHSMFGLSSENTNRIKRQNEKKISVIIGNPPYNANQKNFNDNNQNRKYDDIDKRIKGTYIAEGTAQNQIVLYDMYTRFLRWASDRVEKNGIIAFVSNSSFIDAQSYDGFRKVIAKEFAELWVVNLKGNARTSSERRRKEGGNIFSDQIRVGVAVYFLIRKENKTDFKVYYNEIGDYVKADEKKEYLRANKITDLNFKTLSPDKKNSWINISENDWDEMIPLIDKETKSGKKSNAIFKQFSSGLKSGRDEWVTDFSYETLLSKIHFIIKDFNSISKAGKIPSSSELKIKLDEKLASLLERKIQLKFSNECLVSHLYRPFVKNHLYYSQELNQRTYKWGEIFSPNSDGLFISFSGLGSAKPFHSLVSNLIIGLDTIEKTQCVSLYRYDSTGKRIENITYWGLQQFRERYNQSVIARNEAEQSGESVTKQSPTKKENSKSGGLLLPPKRRDRNDASGEAITKESIFHYCYAVLHNPAYRKKYELNLKREFPRIPFYDDFWKWSTWGKQLMDLHINYETVEPYPLKEMEVDPFNPGQWREVKPDNKYLMDAPPMPTHLKQTPKTKLKADKEAGIIELDEWHRLEGIPAATWEYKLGNRSALEWILDQYKEKKPKDPTIAEKFNTYRFADYKEKVIELLKRVTTVSVETVRIIEKMSEP